MDFPELEKTKVTSKPKKLCVGKKYIHIRFKFITVENQLHLNTICESVLNN